MANKEQNNFKQALNDLLKGQDIKTTTEPDKKAPVPPHNNDIETVISQSVVIEGNLRTTGKLTVMGEITGNVISSNDVYISGKVGGSIHGKNINIDNSKINDTITASNEVKISPNSVITGNVNAASVINEGVINGTISAGSITLVSSSVTNGDAHCKSICINKGATFNGNIKTTK